MHMNKIWLIFLACIPLLLVSACKKTPAMYDVREIQLNISDNTLTAEEKNQVRPDKLTVISTEASKVKALVIPTNEELEIAKQAVDLFEN